MVQLKVQCIGFSRLPHVEWREAALMHRKKCERSCREPEDFPFWATVETWRLRERLPL